MTQDPRHRPLHVVVPVWGAEYVATFLDLALPAQLSLGNLPALPRRPRYVIHTSSSDRATIEAHPATARLREHAELVFQSIDGLLALPAGYGKYRIKTECYRAEIQQAGRAGAQIVMLNADMLLADGFLARTASLLAEGYKVIEVAGSRGLLGPIARELDAAHRRPDGTISIGPTELARLWLRNLHPALQRHVVDGPAGESFHPSHLYWPVGQAGMVIRGFHLYPIAIDPISPFISFGGTIDDDLVANLGVRPEACFIAADSREMFCCELSAPDHHVGDVGARGDTEGIVAFYLRHAAGNAAKLETEIIVTAEPELGPDWEAPRAASARYAAELLAALRAEVARRGGASAPGAAAEPEPVLDMASLSARESDLANRIVLPGFTLAEALELYSSIVADGRPFPPEWEIRTLELGLAEDPERHDMRDRLALLRERLRRRDEATPAEGA
jgi:hypothetical protein